MDQLRINLLFIGEDAKALKALSADECRKPPQQLRWLVRRELSRRGLVGDATLWLNEQRTQQSAQVEYDGFDLGHQSRKRVAGALSMPEDEPWPHVGGRIAESPPVDTVAAAGTDTNIEIGEM